MTGLHNRAGDSVLNSILTFLFLYITITLYSSHTPTTLAYNQPKFIPRYQYNHPPRLSHPGSAYNEILQCSPNSFLRISSFLCNFIPKSSCNNNRHLRYRHSSLPPPWVSRWGEGPPPPPRPRRRRRRHGGRGSEEERNEIRMSEISSPEGGERPHPMQMEMEHLLSLPVNFQEKKVPPKKSSKNKRKKDKLEFQIHEVNSIAKEMDHLTKIMNWEPKEKKNNKRPARPVMEIKRPAKRPAVGPGAVGPKGHLKTQKPINKKTKQKKKQVLEESEEKKKGVKSKAEMMLAMMEIMSAMTPRPPLTPPPKVSMMKQTMQELPTVVRTIPMMMTIAKTAMLLNRKSKQDEEMMQQKNQQQTQFNSNRPNFFSFTNAYLLYSKDPMGEAKKKKKKKGPLNQVQGQGGTERPLTPEELAEEAKRKREQEKSEKTRRAIEKLHLTRAIIGLVSDSLNLASNKINLINTVAGSSLIGGGNNNPGGGGGVTGVLVNGIASVLGNGFTSKDLDLDALKISGNSRNNISRAVDSFATNLTKEAIQNATIT